jgi:hypothetical protein
MSESEVKTKIPPELLEKLLEELPDWADGMFFKVESVRLPDGDAFIVVYPVAQTRDGRGDSYYCKDSWKPIEVLPSLEYLHLDETLVIVRQYRRKLKQPVVLSSRRELDITEKSSGEGDGAHLFFIKPMKAVNI